jgi:hypothetical protein
VASVLYRKPPSQQDTAVMSFLGLSPDDYIQETTAYVWPCHVRAVNLFIEMGTQWRVDSGRPYGLDYNIVYRAIDDLGVSRDEVRRLKDEIRILEDAALEQMRKDQE